jgi:hypothetical protein
MATFIELYSFWKRRIGAHDRRTPQSLKQTTGMSGPGAIDTIL